jgi:hypothetical protein
LAVTHGIEVRQPESLKRDRAAVAALFADPTAWEEVCVP